MAAPATDRVKGTARLAQPHRPLSLGPGAVALPTPWASQTLGTPDSPKINMGMKYPAGMGMVVARTIIQNWGWDQRAGLEASEPGTGQGRDRTDGGSWGGAAIRDGTAGTVLTTGPLCAWRLPGTFLSSLSAFLGGRSNNNSILEMKRPRVRGPK